MSDVANQFDVAKVVVEPVVADRLHQIAQRFGCDPEWRWPEYSFYSGEGVLARPLLAHNTELEMRTGRAVDVGVTADAMPAEQVWTIIDTHMSTQGRPQDGIVNLNTRMHVDFRLFRGVPKPFALANSDSREGWLCWADEYQLEDGPAYRLAAPAGWLWLRPATIAGQLSGAVLQQPRSGPSMRNAARVVHLAESGMKVALNMPGSIGDDKGPWSGLSSKDASGRVWTVDRCASWFSAAVRFSATGGYNNRLSTRPYQELAPPYRVVWELMLDDKEERTVFVPLTLK